VGGGRHGAEILNRHRFPTISFKRHFFLKDTIFIKDTLFLKDSFFKIHFLAVKIHRK